jgi:PTS system mannose-specific IID component
VTPAVPSLDAWTLWRVFGRTFFIQAGFSPEALQALGLLYALEPALQRLYPDEAAHREALRRHLIPFNTHPYVAAGLVGGILFHEVRVARGEAPPETVIRFKQTLMGPLAAVGDSFFWLSLRPAVGAVAVALVPIIQGWAAALFVVLYNVVHLSLRGYLFLQGWRLGDGLVSKLSRVQLPVWGNRLRTLAAATAGALGTWLAMRFGSQAQGEFTPLLALLAFAVGLFALALVERRVRPMWVVYGVAAMAIAAGAAG